jgi:2-polyprenyl-6-methoxyphenol hydroxylase-like FAD-dependent oxidoreductase
MRSSTHGLVVGAGPIGLLLAWALRRQSVDALLIARRPGWHHPALSSAAISLRLCLITATGTEIS